MTMNIKNSLKTWVEIDRAAIKHNYQSFRKILKRGVKLMAVVKSNAYGHGLVPFAKEMKRLGADYFGVDDIDEALILRRNGIKKPILVFGFIPDGQLSEAAKKDIRITVSNFEILKQLNKIKTKNKIKVHIKADTGLGRQGFMSHQVNKVIKFIKEYKNIEIEGLYTHFAGIESQKFLEHTKKQIVEFNIWRNVLKENGFNPICHVASSAGIILHPEYQFDMVRAGILIYGLWPSAEVEKRTKLKLRPALSWKTIISEIKKLPKGSKIGYDLTETLKRDSLVGVCPVGYWHGYPRALSGKGEVLIKGKRVRVLGRVSMDMMVVDVTRIRGVRAGDEVILIGSKIKAEQIAERAGTINYEIVTRINPGISRIYK